MMATKFDIAAFLAQEFPHTHATVESVGNRSAVVRREIGMEELRPGGTVSGPTLMAVADLALYVAIFGEIGIVPMAVTTSLNINFLRRPSASAAVVGQCKLMKVGKSLVVGEVSLFSEGEPEPIAHVVGTYSLPPGARPPAQA